MMQRFQCPELPLEPPPYGVQTILQAKCCECDELWPIEQIKIYMNGDCVCPDCEMKYLKHIGADYVEEYIDQNPAEYYMDWWFSSLTPQEQLEIIRGGYEKRKQLEGESFAVDRAEYCRETDGFIDFVQEKIC